jgi:cation-transporting ATPase I
MDLGRVARLCAGAGVHAATMLISTSVGAATLPLRVGADLILGSGSVDSAFAVARELVGGEPSRRCWQGGGRAWIEVRGLAGPSGDDVLAAVLADLRALAGVTSAEMNVPLSRAVISVTADGPALGELCALIEEAEARAGAGEGRTRHRVPDLPGDGVVLMGRLATVTANAAGLCAAVAGRSLGLPRLPGMVSAAVTVIDYQPRLRRILEDGLGQMAANTVVGLGAATAYTLTLAPASLAVDLGVQLVQAAESRSGQRTWSRWEPSLAEHADCPVHLDPSTRPRPRPPGPIERHGDRSGLAQIVGATAIGIATRNPAAAATAAVVAAPKATRSVRESFAGTLGRGLADRHAVLALRPEALRRLDRVDVVLFDPRVLCTGALRIQAIDGVPDARRTQAWEGAVAELAHGVLGAGRHRLEAPWSGARRTSFEVLVCPAPDPLASAVIGEVRTGGAEVMSLDVDDLGDLRSAFDDLRPAGGQSIDAALAHAVARLQEDDHTVALVTSAAAQALSGADVAIGVWSGGGGPPTWHAHLMVEDLAAVWQLVHALPSARAASRSGVQISIGASLLGTLLMVPGVRGRGPGPVTAGAGAGLFTGFRLAREALGAEVPAPVDVVEWHAMSAPEVREALPSPDHAGKPAPRPLPLAVVGASLGVLGKVVGPPQRLVAEFVGAMRTELADPLTPVLAIGAAASAVLGSPVDAVLVGSVVAGNAALAASQQVHAQRLLRRLLAVQEPPARLVVEDGSERQYRDVPALRLRPGDLIEVRTNEVVPADARLIEAVDLEVEEAALTGESLPVTKQVAPTPGAPLGDRACMMFAQTTVVTGTGVAVVTAVGEQTQARRALVGAPGGDPSVGLQAQLAALTDRAWPVSLAGGAVVSALGLLRRGGLRTAVASGVAVSVAAVPEGLPLVATLAQQASARRLTTAGALVRSPRSVEALGRVDVVCFDKTGTLSENRLRVSRVHPAPGVAGADVLECAARATADPVGGVQLHATDSAVVEAVSGADSGDRLAHLPFRSGRAYSASVCGRELTIKGAPEVLLAASAGDGDAIAAVVGEMAADGLRVIAVARRTLTAAQVAAAVADPDAMADLCGRGLQIMGLLGLSDTPRPQAAALLAALAEQQLGVRLITGDHPITAMAIATELGLDVDTGQVITGAEWEALPRRGQERAVTDRVVFARMSPEHKVQVVQTLERIGLVCAMVGDGANDAAAIRAATVGVGVASRGSDPARLAADVMLLDGRIESLLDALDEGRQLWRRVQAAVAVLLGGNAGEVTFAIIGSALTGRSPLNARQLLLVNMLTDALPAAALAVSPPTARMRSAGRGPDQAALWRTVAVRGGATAAAATAAWVAASMTGRPQRASTVGLVALVGAQLGQTLLDSHSPLVVVTAAGSMTVLAGAVMTPGLSQLLGCTPLGPLGWAQALGSAAVATAGAALVPVIAERLSPSPESGGDGGPQSTISTTPARQSTAYNSRNGTANKRVTAPVNGSASAPLVSSDTPRA